MTTQNPGIILTQSRALIAAASIALFGGTILAGIGFVRLAAAVFGAARFRQRSPSFSLSTQPF